MGKSLIESAMECRNLGEVKPGSVTLDLGRTFMSASM